MKKSILLILLLFTIFPVKSFAKEFKFNFCFNESILEADVGISGEISGTLLEFGGFTKIIDQEDYISGLKIFIKSDKMIPGLRYGIGFKYVTSNSVGFEDNEDYEFTALAPSLFAEYDFMYLKSKFKLPIYIFCGITYAPKSLCFFETEQYIEVNLNIGGYVLPETTAYVGYQYYRVTFEDDDKENFEYNISGFVIGLTYTYQF